MVWFLRGESGGVFLFLASSNGTTAEPAVLSLSSSFAHPLSLSLPLFFRNPLQMCGATTTLIYGANLVLDPVSEEPEKDESSEVPGMVKVAFPYHVRVMVPCYSEPLDIISKTCEAAQRAALPAGCRVSWFFRGFFRVCFSGSRSSDQKLRTPQKTHSSTLSLPLFTSLSSTSNQNQVTVYLCDDGKDPKKRRWCMAPGRGVVYVSGRTRASGEMNGKSANLNNCAKQIYPEGQPIPPNEIICVFDADQVANPDFFLKMLYKFDAGEDVAMVLSPQSFYNTNLRADIFNHSNTHFWEYAQHGYDALGFISCTGTNFLIRSAAFRDAG